MARRRIRELMVTVTLSILIFILLTILRHFYRIHSARKNFQEITGEGIRRPMGMELNDLPPMPFSAYEHILPDHVLDKYAIVNVIESDTHPSYYQHAMLSVACYARAQGYEFRIIISTDFSKQCKHKDVYLRRHCVVAEILPNYHTILYIDADMGVVNPKKRIEDYIDSDTEIAFFDRFYNWEIAAGSYIVRNSEWSRRFLKGFANFEYRLPDHYHGTDNGALHAKNCRQITVRNIPEGATSLIQLLDVFFFGPMKNVMKRVRSFAMANSVGFNMTQRDNLLKVLSQIYRYIDDHPGMFVTPGEYLFGLATIDCFAAGCREAASIRCAAYLAEILFSKTRKSELAFCLHIYYNLKSYEDLFTFEACIKQMLGMFTKIGNIQIYKKGTAWVRDNWMTNSKWSPDRDFMLHNWKIVQLRRYEETDLPLTLHGPSKGEWFNPFKGQIDLDLCAGNTTWNYDENLIDTRERIDSKLAMLYDKIDKDRIKSLSRVSLFL